MSRVLVVDDNVDIIELVLYGFTKDGWTTESIIGGRPALARIEQGGIDLVISDIRMPNGTGIDLMRGLRRMQKERETPPVIIMTGLLEKGESYLRALGAKAIFMKPLSLKELIKTANELVKKP